MTLMSLMRIQALQNKNASSRGIADNRSLSAFYVIPREAREPRETVDATDGTVCGRAKAIAGARREQDQPDRHWAEYSVFRIASKCDIGYASAWFRHERAMADSRSRSD